MRKRLFSNSHDKPLLPKRSIHLSASGGSCDPGTVHAGGQERIECSFPPQVTLKKLMVFTRPVMGIEAAATGPLHPEGSGGILTTPALKSAYYTQNHKCLQ